MRQTAANTETERITQTEPAPSGFWARARELAEWMEEQDSMTN